MIGSATIYLLRSLDIPKLIRKYMARSSCPICGAKLGKPTMSRFKKRTQICEACGVAEALNDFITHETGVPKAKSWKEHKRRILIVRDSFKGDNPDQPIDLHAIITGERTVADEEE